MYRLICFIAALTFLHCPDARSQHTFKQVDSLSYALYMQQEWNLLTDLGKEIADEQFDYYYLNLRLGIAHFRLGEYKEAIQYFNNAEGNNSAGTVAGEYLYWSHRLLNEVEDADRYFDMLSDSLKQAISIKKIKVVESMFLAGGIRVSKYKSLAGNVGVFTAGLNHDITKRTSIAHSYTFIAQSFPWGKYRQNEYFITPKVGLKNDWEVSLGIHYAHYSGDYDLEATTEFSVSSPVQTPLGPILIDSMYHREQSIEGSYQENGLLIQFTAQKLFENFEISPYIAVFSRYSKPNYSEQVNDDIIVQHTTEAGDVVNEFELNRNSENTVSQNSSSHQAILGVNAFYFNKWVTIGGNLYYTGTNRSHRVGFSPFLGVRPMERLEFSSYFFHKKSNTLSLFNASELYSSFDNELKLSITASYAISNRVSLYATYQYDKITDWLSADEYHLNSYITGLKIKL